MGIRTVSLRSRPVRVTVRMNPQRWSTKIAHGVKRNAWQGRREVSFIGMQMRLGSLKLAGGPADAPMHSCAEVDGLFPACSQRESRSVVLYNRLPNPCLLDFLF